MSIVGPVAGPACPERSGGGRPWQAAGKCQGSLVRRRRGSLEGGPGETPEGRPTLATHSQWFPSSGSRLRLVLLPGDSVGTLLNH